MGDIYFSLNCIPDISLGKYQSLAETGPRGVLNRHKAFLRQWRRLGLLSGISLHLIAEYNPERPKGYKLSIGLLTKCPDTNTESHARKVMASSPLSEFFSLRPEMPPRALIEDIYPVRALLSKRERFLRPLPREGAPPFFYLAPGWTVNEDARLLDMFRLMEAIDRKVVFRVDLYAVDLTAQIREVFDSPLRWLRGNIGAVRGVLTGQTQSMPRDHNAEETLRQYEEWQKALDTTPHFRMMISTLSDSVNDATLILDAAGAEAISEGDYSIYVETGSNYSVIPKFLESEDIAHRDAPEKLRSWPTSLTLDEVAPFFRLPVLYEGETIELPKETASALNIEGLSLGKTSDGHGVCLPLSLLNKHAFIAGMPGAGKTNTLIHMASTLWKEHRIPFLILEPAKQEYRALANFDIPELIVFSPSAGSQFPLLINPFEFPIGLTLAEHIRRLTAVFEGAFPLYPPMPFLLDKAVEGVYREKRWKPEDINDGTRAYPTMSDLYNRLNKEIEATSYEGELKGNLRSGLEMRIGSLLRREMGEVFDTPRSTLKPEAWFKVPILIELESMGPGPANFLTLMLCTLLRETLKANPRVDGDKPRHILFLEEAHNLIGPEATEVTSDEGNPKQAATAFLVKMLAEVRALRQGIVIADQLPSAMAPEVLKNTGLKISHRLTAGDDRSMLGVIMGASDFQTEALATYMPGDALISYEGLLRPFRMKTNLAGSGKYLLDSPNDTILLALLSKSPYFLAALERTAETRRDIFVNTLTTIRARIDENFSEQQALDKLAFSDTRQYSGAELENKSIILAQEWVRLVTAFNTETDAYKKIIKRFLPVSYILEEGLREASELAKYMRQLPINFR